VDDQFHIVLSQQRLRVLHRPILLLLLLLVAGRLVAASWPAALLL